MKKLLFILLFIFFSINIYSQEITISGVIDWEKMEIQSAVSLDLASIGVRLPAGRNRAVSILQENYIVLVRNAFKKIQIDSSNTIGDVLNGELIGHNDLDTLSKLSIKDPPYLSSDMRNMQVNYAIPFVPLYNIFQQHRRPASVSRVLNPVTTENFTGIILIADEPLLLHGQRSSALAIPCLFPKIWDSGMNLIYDRQMLIPGNPSVHYNRSQNIFLSTPSGLSSEIQSVVGNNPLKIFAKGIFGNAPTDLIIDREDALKIISQENNRNLLTQGKVVIILNDSVLIQEFDF